MLVTILEASVTIANDILTSKTLLYMIGHKRDRIINEFCVEILVQNVKVPHQMSISLCYEL